MVIEVRLDTLVRSARLLDPQYTCELFAEDIETCDINPET